MKKTVISAAVLAMAALLSTSCASAVQDTAEVTDCPVLHIGSALDAPYFYMGDDGRYTGLDKAIADEACRRLGWTSEYTVFTWGSQRELLETGAVDCIWDSYAMNGREDMYQWVGPYLEVPEQIVVAADSDIYTIDDLCGKTIAARIESKGEDYFLKEGGTAVLQDAQTMLCTFDSTSDAFAYFGKGYADAAVGHGPALQSMAAQYPELYRFLEESPMELELGVAFAKDHDTAQIEALRQTLAEMKADGTIDAIAAPYRVQDGKAGASDGK